MPALAKEITWPKHDDQYDLAHESWPAEEWTWTLPGCVLYFILVSSPSFRGLLHAVIAYFVAVAAHEAGHLIGGAIAGFKLITFAVWPFEVYRNRDTWRFKWMQRPGMAGYTEAYPVYDSNFRKRMSIVVAAGPVASIVVGVGAAVFEAPSLACWSLLGVLQLLPIRSDGMRLRMLLRGGPEVDRFRRLVFVEASSVKGLAPREWDPELLSKIEGPADGSPDALSAQGCRYNWLLDTGQVEEAGKVLHLILSLDLHDVARAGWWLEAAWFEARFRSDSSNARAYFAGVPVELKGGANQCELYKAQAAIAFLEQRWDDLDAALEAALKGCEAMDELGMARANRDDLIKLKADSDAQR